MAGQPNPPTSVGGTWPGGPRLTIAMKQNRAAEVELKQVHPYGCKDWPQRWVGLAQKPREVVVDDLLTSWWFRNLVRSPVEVER